MLKEPAVPETARILVVDDNPSNIKALRQRLELEGYEVLEATDGMAALACAARDRPDLVLLDIMMPGMDGFEVCRRLKEVDGAGFFPVIMVTALDTRQALVRALDEGADEFVRKPFEPVELMARVRSMLRIRRMYQENTLLREEIRTASVGSAGLIGDSQAMQRIHQILQQVADSRVTVLLTGESGTGKEAVARTMHQRGQRHEGRFVAVNCGSLSEGLLESELFGHRRGSFSGAVEDRVGLFEAASEGTIFLDEIGETSPSMQTRLLRVLQESEVTPVGETEARPINARVIAATNRDLQAEVANGTFREDLFYRLSVFPIHIPPLRERRDDIPALVRHFLERHRDLTGGTAARLTAQAIDALMHYDWPGNVRELENEIERALVLATDDGTVDVTLLSEKISGPAGPTSRRRRGRLRDVVADAERELIGDTLKAHAGNRSRAAEALGITRYTLLQKLRQFGLDESI
ncbi:MAG: sigma-54 dependent transcriptional regulator [bacterium]|nr:sigma-54 dependent transcriptional regulator [bacterium]